MPPVASSPAETVDVVLVTALHEEYLEVLQVLDGASKPQWVERPDGPFGRVVVRQQFVGADGRPFTVIATWADGMAGDAAAAIAGILQSHFRPRCLAMTGIAAGPRGKVALGDVVFGHRVVKHDTGKKTAKGRGSERTEGFKGDLNPPPGPQERSRGSLRGVEGIRIWEFDLIERRFSESGSYGNQPRGPWPGLRGATLKKAAYAAYPPEPKPWGDGSHRVRAPKRCASLAIPCGRIDARQRWGRPLRSDDVLDTPPLPSRWAAR